MTTEAIQQLAADYRDRERAFNELNAVYAERRADIEAAIQALEEAFKRDNAELIATLDEAEKQVPEADAALRNAVIEAYRETGEKQIMQGFSVRVNRKPVYDPGVALDWAKTHQFCLALDKKAFEKLATVQDIPFVSYEETPVAVISWDKAEAAK